MNERGPRRVLRIGKASFAYRIWKTPWGRWASSIDCQTQNAGMGGPLTESALTRDYALQEILARARVWFTSYASDAMNEGSVLHAPEDCKKMVEALNTDGLFGFVEPREEIEEVQR